MVEVIGTILVLVTFAAMVAAIIGVVIGFRTKRWKAAIITGSIFGGLFIVFTIFMSATGQLDDQTETTRQESPQQASALPAAAPTHEPEPTATPKPNLGIGRDEVQSDFELFFKRQGIEFEPTTATSGNPAIMGVTESKRIALVLEGTEDELSHAVLQLQIGGFLSDDEMEDVMKSIMLLAELIAPKWEREEWIPEALSTASKLGAANIETVHDGKLIKFIYTTSPTEIIFFSIEPELAVPEQVEQVPMNKPDPTAEPIPRGLELTRGELIRILSEFGYQFITEEFCPEPCTSIRSDSNMNVIFWLHGPHTNLDKVRVEGNLFSDSDSADTGVAIAELLHIVMPDSSDAVRNWLRTEVLESLDSASGDVLFETLVIGDKQVQVEMHRATGKLYLSVRREMR